MFRALSMLIVFVISMVAVGCRAPVNYGFDPEANRDFWENQEITQVMTIYPGSFQSSVSATTPIRFTFSKEVGMSKENFSICDLSNRGHRLRYTLVPSDDGRTYTAALREPLNYARVYLCEVKGVKDSKGKDVPNMSWTFTTRSIPENILAPPAKWRSDYSSGRWY